VRGVYHPSPFSAGVKERFSASPSRKSVKGITINGVTYEGVAEFIYLGTLISNDNSVEKRNIKKYFGWK